MRRAAGQESVMSERDRRWVIGAALVGTVAGLVALSLLWELLTIGVFA
jgi:hypothetical protein